MIAEYALIMRKAILGIAVAATLTACGGSGGTTASAPPPFVTKTAPSKVKTGNTTSRARTSSPKKTATHPPRYPGAVETRFMVRCLPKASRGMCNCALSYLEAHIKLAQVQAAPVGQLITWESEAAASCSAR